MNQICKKLMHLCNKILKCVKICKNAKNFMQIFTFAPNNCNHYRHRIILKVIYNLCHICKYAIIRDLIGSVLHVTPAVSAALHPDDTRRHATGRSGWLAIQCEAWLFQAARSKGNDRLVSEKLNHWFCFATFLMWHVVYLFYHKIFKLISKCFHWSWMINKTYSSKNRC